jgi:hypothetical protein
MAMCLCFAHSSMSSGYGSRLLGAIRKMGNAACALPLHSRRHIPSVITYFRNINVGYGV